MALRDFSAQGTFGALVEATATTALSSTLDRNKIYSVHHTGLASDGSAATGDVILGYGGVPAAQTRAEALNKGILKSNTVIDVGPGVDSLHYYSLSGSPMLNIIASQSDFGNH